MPPQENADDLIQDQAQASAATSDSLPTAILYRFLAAVTNNDPDAFIALLDEHFPDRTQATHVQGNGASYHINELKPVLDLAVQKDCAAIAAGLLVYPLQSLTNVSIGDLARAAVCHQSKSVFLVLLDHGCDFDETRGDLGGTVLADAVTLEDHDMALWLLQHGASLNIRPLRVDKTAMSMAVECSSPGFVAELLDKHGGDVSRGQLLHHAVDRRVRPGVDCKSDIDDMIQVLGTLLDRGASVNSVMYENDPPSQELYSSVDLGTALHKAAAYGDSHISVVFLLLEKGADPKILSSKGKTALEWAEEAAAEGQGNHRIVLDLLRDPDLEGQ